MFNDRFDMSVGRGISYIVNGGKAVLVSFSMALTIISTSAQAEPKPAERSNSSRPSNPFKLRESAPGIVRPINDELTRVILYVHDEQGRVINEYLGSLVTMTPQSGGAPIVMLITEDGMATANVPIGSYDIKISPRASGETIRVTRIIDRLGGTSIISILL